MSAPARVERLDDRRHPIVLLSLDPGLVVPALLRVLAGWRLTARDAASEASGPSRDAARDRIAADPDISDALTVALLPAQARRLAEDLTAAATEEDAR